jgi:hypothetical protein
VSANRHFFHLRGRNKDVHLGRRTLELPICGKTTLKAAPNFMLIQDLTEGMDAGVRLGAAIFTHVSGSRLIKIENTAN